VISEASICRVVSALSGIYINHV